MSLNLNKEADGDTAQLAAEELFDPRHPRPAGRQPSDPEGLAGRIGLHHGSDGHATTGVASLNGLTVKDSALTLQDDGDASKQARFELSALSTATTRTYSLPNVTATPGSYGGPRPRPSPAR